ncbi:GFA family protein [Lysobacter sp. D1-1-M9]|uniref:GFA family protein n=1 Tax=Novilysobacter longmucuonensis TaxID=3098603 RepID=UPI003983B56A
MELTGGCLCGQISYEITAPLRSARSCHCSRCRKAFSGAGSAYAEVEAGSFQWVAGERSLVCYRPMPGWALCFCGACGSTLCGTLDGVVHGVTLGCVDGNPNVEIEMHIFVGSRAPWDHIGGSAPQFPESPANSGSAPAGAAQQLVTPKPLRGSA